MRLLFVNQLKFRNPYGFSLFEIFSPGLAPDDFKLLRSIGSKRFEKKNG